MFSKGVLSVAVCIGVSAGSSKADFEADLLSVLSPDGRGFSEEVCDDPVHWGKLYDLYKAYKSLYGNFCKDIRVLVKSRELTVKTCSSEENPDALAGRAFCLLKFSRDVYGKVFEYMSSARDLDEEDAFKDVDALLLSECHRVFVRRLLGLSKFIIRYYAQELDLSAFVDTKDREPDEKILAEILKPFAKEDAYKELQSNDNNLQLIQSLHVLSKVFDKFLRNNNEVLEEMKEAFGEPLSSRFGISISCRETDYREYVLGCSEKLSVALRDLSQNVLGRINRMLSVKEKLSAEQKREGLPFFKGEKDIGELLKVAESFRIKEKEVRKNEQEAFVKAKAKREGLESEIVAKKKALKAKKDALCKITEDGTEVLDKKKELEGENQKLKEEIETLKRKINKLSHSSMKDKRKMERKAAEESISREVHDGALFANYVQLPGKCGAFLNVFLYYQTIMWNVFTDAAKTMKPYGQKIYVDLKITEPLLTNDFEEEYIRLTAGS